MLLAYIEHPSIKIKLKIFFASLLFTLLSTGLFAQSKTKVQEYEYMISKTTADTTKIRLLNLLAVEYENNEPKKATLLANKALKLAKKKLSDKRTGTLEKNILRKEMADAYYTIANVHRFENSYEKALQNYERALAINLEINNSKGVAFVNNGIGLLFAEQGKYNDALKKHFESLKLKQHIGDKKGMANSYRNIGRVYEKQGNDSKALDMHFKSLTIDKSISNKKGIALGYTNISSVYGRQKKFKDALSINLKAIDLLTELNDKKAIVRTYNDIGILCKNLKRYDDALKYYLKSLKIAETTNDQFVIGGIYMNMGNFYLSQQQYDKALVYLLNALKLMQKTQNIYGLSICLINLGNVYTKQEKYSIALTHYYDALEKARAIGAHSLITNCYSGLAETYSAIPDYKKAYEYQKLYTALSDSLLSEENLKQINELKIRYETENKDQEIQILNKEKKIQQIKLNAKIRVQTIQRNIFIVGFIATLLLIIFAVNRYRHKLKSRALIDAQNMEITRQKTSILAEEKERKRIAQELHDGLGGTLAAIKLNLIKINTSNNISELESTITYISDACKEVRTIAHNLTPPAFNNNLFTNVLNECIQRFIVPQKTQINFECFPKDELNLIAEELKTDVYRIVQELLNNISKHAQASRVDIEVLKENNLVHIMIEDNGKGFDTSAANKGIGLTNIESRIKVYNGKILIDSVPGRGTAVNIQLEVLNTSHFILR